jgi:hypothetical protein
MAASPHRPCNTNVAPENVRAHVHRRAQASACLPQRRAGGSCGAPANRSDAHCGIVGYEMRFMLHPLYG